MDPVAVIHASQLLTLRGPARPRVGPEMRDLGIVEDGAMIVRDRAIEWVGRTDDLSEFEGETIDASGCCVLPGFVDAHTHAIFGGTRAAEFEMRCEGKSYQEIAAAGGGIQSTVAQTSSMTVDELAAAGAEHMRWMIAGGTTTIECKSGYGADADDEYKLIAAAIRAALVVSVIPCTTFLGAHSKPLEGTRDQKLAEIKGAIQDERFKNSRFFDAFCEPGYYSVDECRDLLTMARSRGFSLKLHADQFSNSGGARLAAEMGCVTADHLEHTDSAGISALRGAGVIPILLPGSVYALGLSKYPAAREMIEQGLPVALATDFNPGSSPTPSIPTVLSLACNQMKMTPAECVTATTINAAFGLLRGELTGSLEVGKAADFAIHECPDYRELAYFFGYNRARHVYSAGKRIGGQARI